MVKIKKSTSQKILDIENQYVQLLKLKINSLRKWEFEKKIYKKKIDKLKIKNKKLRQMLNNNSCCVSFFFCRKINKIYIQDDDLLESSNLSDTLDASLENYQDESLDSPEKKNNTIKMAKIGATAAIGLLL